MRQNKKQIAMAEKYFCRTAFILLDAGSRCKKRRNTCQYDARRAETNSSARVFADEAAHEVNEDELAAIFFLT